MRDASEIRAWIIEETYRRSTNMLVVGDLLNFIDSVKPCYCKRSDVMIFYLGGQEFAYCPLCGDKWPEPIKPEKEKKPRKVKKPTR